MSYAKQLEKLEKENAQAKARVKDLGARRRKLMRKADARRKVLYGVAVLALLKDLPEAKRQATMERLHAKITKKADREFLSLEVAGATLC